MSAAGAIIAAAAMIAGCSRSDAPPAGAARESVAIAMPLGISGALVILAQKKGYFAAEGLDAKLTPTATSVAALGMVDRGEADVTMSSDTPFVFAVLEGKNIRLLARAFRSRTYMAIVARKDRGIERPADLAGKRIGIVPGTSSDYFSGLYLEFRGLRPGAFTRVALAVAEVESALQNGEVDAVSIWHPYNSRLAARLGPRAIVFHDPAIYQLRFNLVARPEFSAARPEAARKFMAALQTSQAFVRDNPDEARRLLLDVTKDDPEILGRLWQESDFNVTLDQSLLSGLEAEARWALGRRAKSQATLPNFLEFIDARPLKSAHPDAVSILLP